MKKMQGFTLIELMIVVAIIGILAAVALPAYQDYTTRSKIGASIVLVSELKPHIIDFYKARYRFPTNNEEAGIPDPDYIIGNFVKRVSVVDGAMHIELGNKVRADMMGKILTLRPIVVTGSPESPVSWICGGETPPEGMESVGENRTDVEMKYLPANCRY